MVRPIWPLLKLTAFSAPAETPPHAREPGEPALHEDIEHAGGEHPAEPAALEHERGGGAGRCLKLDRVLELGGHRFLDLGIHIHGGLLFSAGLLCEAGAGVDAVSTPLPQYPK